MRDIEAIFKTTATLYNRSQPHFDFCTRLVDLCLRRLADEADYRHFGFFNGTPKVAYHVFENGAGVSRPLRPDLFVTQTDVFAERQGHVLELLKRDPSHWQDCDVQQITSVIYTAVMSFACCIDLWKRSSRKTPGTFFEIYFAGLLPFLFPDALLSKHIPLPGITETEEDFVLEEEGADNGDSSSVATDLVVSRPNSAKKLVIPLKITTRERIVQPFAHQRILDSAFGPGVYHSFLTCVSETQLDHKSASVKQVCVPGTVKLFQRNLGQISGLYYCDVPQRYAAPDMASYLPVKEIGEIFKDFSRFFND